jgi:hypothetical protein
MVTVPPELGAVGSYGDWIEGMKPGVPLGDLERMRSSIDGLESSDCGPGDEGFCTGTPSSAAAVSAGHRIGSCLFALRLSLTAGKLPRAGAA